MVAAAERCGKELGVAVEPLEGGKWLWRVFERVGLLERDMVSGVSEYKKMAGRMAGMAVSMVLGEE